MKLDDAEKMVKDLMAKHGLIAKGWTFKFTRGGHQRWGCCYGGSRRLITLSTPMVELNDCEAVEQAALHEVAHALTPGDGHGPKWKAKAKDIGYLWGRQTNTTQIKMPARTTTLFTGTCPACGRTTTGHRRRNEACTPCCKLHSGGKYDAKFAIVWTRPGEPTRATVAQPIVTTPPVVVPTPTPPTPTVLAVLSALTLDEAVAEIRLLAPTWTTPRPRGQERAELLALGAYLLDRLYGGDIADYRSNTGRPKPFSLADLAKRLERSKSALGRAVRAAYAAKFTDAPKLGIAHLATLGALDDGDKIKEAADLIGDHPTLADAAKALAYVQDANPNRKPFADYWTPTPLKPVDLVSPVPVTSILTFGRDSVWDLLDEMDKLTDADVTDRVTAWDTEDVRWLAERAARIAKLATTVTPLAKAA